MADLEPSSIQSSPKAGGPARPPDLGTKFDSDGSALPFPGNTIIWHLDEAGAFYKWLLGLKVELKKELGSKPIWLPEHSWHVTVFEGVCDKVRKDGFWPADLRDTTLEECDNVFSEKLSGFDLTKKPPYRFKFEGGMRPDDTIALRVLPATDDDEKWVRGFRDELSGLLGIKHPVHDVYAFHITIAYLTEHLDAGETMKKKEIVHKHLKLVPGQLELGAPEFCCFKDMCKFDRKCFLGN